MQTEQHIPVLDRAPLNVGATRPAMIFGSLPWLVVMPTVLACAEIDVLFGDRIALMIDPVLAFTFCVMAWRDYNAPRIWGVWLYTVPARIGAYFHGGAAVSPFPIRAAARPPFYRKPKRSRGIPSNAW